VFQISIATGTYLSRSHHGVASPPQQVQLSFPQLQSQPHLSQRHADGVSYEELLRIKDDYGVLASFVQLLCRRMQQISPLSKVGGSVA
jgi:hypothetical protein